MKKIISIAVCAAILGIVGCASQDKSDTSSYKSTVSQVDAGLKTKCKHKKCHQHVGKLGEEKLEQDTAK